MKKNLKGILCVLSIVAIVLFLVNVYQNKKIGYAELNEIDRTMLSELDMYFKANKTEALWEGYGLQEKTILALDGSWGKGYLINPEKEEKSIFAKEIEMPEWYEIKVYRLAEVTPELLKFRISNSFNLIDSKYHVLGNEVYFTKYSEESFSQKHDSNHYLTFLTHEAFHYYMQQKWPQGSRTNTDLLTDKDLDLLHSQYLIMSDMQKTLKNSDVEKLVNLTKKYVEIMGQRKSANPQYVQDENIVETVEGTATYVSMLASEAIGYDFKYMNFMQDAKTVEIPFSAIVPAIREGKIDKSTLSTEWCYHSGSMLCEVLETLNVSKWQERLNQQNEEEIVTLQSLLEEFVEAEEQAK